MTDGSCVFSCLKICGGLCIICVCNIKMENASKSFSKNVLDKLEHLKCPICLDIVTNLRELPCRHIFCSDCLETYKKNNDSLSCPLCKKEISKRKLLTYDAALDSLCIFVKTLCDDVKLHHKHDIQTFFSDAYKECEVSNKLKTVSESDDLIPQSSEENIIPCTLKPNDKKKSFRKKNLNEPKLAIKTGAKLRELQIKKNPARDEKTKSLPKLGLPRNQNKAKKNSTNNSVSNVRPKLVSPHPLIISKPCSNKNTILQWLHDTRNIFERCSQTQFNATESNTPLDIDIPSVSQIYVKKPNINKKSVQEKPSILHNDQEILNKRARSVENLTAFEGKKLRRHSLECSSPIKRKQYQNLQEMNNIENKLIIDIIEDEVLDVIDKEVSSENNKKKTPLSSKKKETDKNSKFLNTKENEFLDQLDFEMSRNPENTEKKGCSRKIDFNSTGMEHKSKSSWQSIKKFRKTIGKTKVPKKLDISLQSTQRSIKKGEESKQKTTDKLPNILITENKTVDFQKMEEYFSKAIPQMIEKNIEVSPASQSIIYQKEIEASPIQAKISDIYQKGSKSNEKFNNNESKPNDENEKDNDSDIYIYQTQPLSTEILDTKTDKISYAAKLAKKLDILLQELTREDKISTDELTSLFPSIENIFKIFDQFELKISNISQKLGSKIKTSYSEKQIQTDMLSLEGFHITPNAIFNSLVREDVGTQTDNCCPNCPHSCSKPQINITHSPTSPTIGSEIASKSWNKSISKKEKSLEFEQDYIAKKSQTKKVGSQTKSPLLKKTENFNSPSSKFHIKSSLDEKMETSPAKKQISPNLNEGKNNNTSVVIESQISLAHILEQCNTQFNFAAPPNVTKIAEINSASTVENKNESKLNTSEGSAIMCSLPQSFSSVNRKLMFDRALKERNELEESLKRGRSENMSGSEEERPYKVRCNRFLQDDLSIEFETESLNENSQYVKNADALMELPTDSPNVNNKLISCEITKNENSYKRTQHLGEHTQADTLLNYCDDLIEKANRQISHINILSEHNDDVNSSQISEINKSIRTNEEFRQSLNTKYSEVKSQQANEKIKTQDLLKHYDELIDKASKQIGVENISPEQRNKKIQYSSSQIATTSKVTDALDDDHVQKQKNDMKTQDLLDHYNALIAKTTKEISRNEMVNEDKTKKIQSQNDDDFLCQNLDQLDRVLETENKRIGSSGEKLSESLFESCKENLIDEISVLEKKAVDDREYVFSTPKRRKSIDNHENRKKFKVSNQNEVDGFNSSDDEIFSDVDVVETTPQKSLSFMERISCSQIVNPNSRTLSIIQENIDAFPGTIDIVPPPPGFDDEEDKEEKPDTEKIIGNSERESENVIPNSLSPSKFEVPLPKRPLLTSNLNSKNTGTPQEPPTLSQQFMKVSPICREKSKSMNVIEMVRQSKFSPLTILPKSHPSLSTSTPKQKSILSYVKPKSKTSQETVDSISTLEKPKPCVAFSRLNNAETLCVLSLCNKNLATRQDKFGPDVTHIIVSVDKHNNVKDHTIKFIYAIAAGIWVLNIKWVQECLAKNYIVDEEPYEVLDITGIPSPRISRLSRVTNPLLKGFKFFIPRSFSQTSAEDVKNIIQLLQGVVVSSIKELTATDREKYTCIIISELVDTEDYTQYENWLVSHKLITVDINWLSLSVSRYKILSLRPHLICSDDSIEDLGYPSNLVADVAPTLTQDLTVFD